jgi:hypothetical protein
LGCSQAHDQGIGQINVLENIIKAWYETSVFGGFDDEGSDNPLDAIEDKLKRISGLCDQLINKLDLARL